VKILITGANGQLGRALVATAPDGHMLAALTRADMDLADADSIAAAMAAHRPDVVVNAAAYTAVDKAESEPEIAQRINADAVGLLRRCCAETGARLVHVSTDFVFDGSASRAYCASDMRNPLSAYGRSKAAGEDMAGPDALIVRTAWVYAAGGASFVATMLRLMREREEIGVVADQIGAPTWASSLARTIWGLVAGGASGIHHFSDAGVASWYDFAVAIGEEAAAIGLIDRTIAVKPIATADYPTPAVRPAFSLLDSRETRKAAGVDPVHWRQNLRLMLQEVKAHG
jgi:dTDP-4-dehydrorhamnose reductase